ncbi:hypothetical protein HMPREF0020_03504 [Acinetobacter baumannii 6013113]|nr:hypothetical protein HMPREF0020_03504 [Acinetobacter baumannii 6013113]
MCVDPLANRSCLKMAQWHLHWLSVFTVIEHDRCKMYANFVYGLF